ncbi:hypothetical protein UVI_02024080 [Ustilaginoidea virens]|uniref:AB hydrolase-1 domain-containing protein n=1 Tax=Ustilaginoidea virens TaxID=1159556 RepID=A0A1B5L1T8_USTVR|nr:hypothetical protein UVI_02024080 [Ustilaginoidea virens]
MATRFSVREHVVDASHIRDFARATSTSQDAVLKLHVKQYLPLDNPAPRKGDVTIIGAHANAFPKEIYEPLWDDLHQELGRHGLRIRAVWIADCAWQGRSGVLNLRRGVLGNDPGWFDYARDIVHLVNTFRMPRPLVAVGHSFGACALSHAALLHPRLFHSLVLLDPVIAMFHEYSAALGMRPAAASIRRRDAWPSRSHAAALLRKSPFCRSWDPRAFDRWIRFGLCSVDDDRDDHNDCDDRNDRDDHAHQADHAAAQVTLATTRHQEVFTFLRPAWPAFDPRGERVVDPKRMPDCGTSLHVAMPMYPFYRAEPIATFARMADLRPGVLFIVGGTSTVVPPPDVARRTDITGTGLGGSGGVPAGRVRLVSHPDHGHLIPLESPAFCAREAAAFLERELSLWAEEEQEYDEWASRSADERTQVSREWKAHLDMSKDRPKI